ncbi:MAG: SDR family oxidoreductase [Acidimicrobiia bacterium]
MAGKILVVGATGNVGSGVVASLVGKGADVRGLAHSDEGATAVREAGAEAVVGELTDPGSLAGPFDGIDVAFIVTPGTENQVEIAGNAIKAAKRAGVGRIVRSSAFVPEPALDTALGRQHHEIERLVESSGVPYTILKPTFFMQNIMGAAQTVASDSVMYWPFGDGRAGMIDVRDVVDVAVEVSTSHGHEGITYTLTGPASISMHDVAATFTKVLGKKIEYVDVPVEAAVQGMVGMGMPQFMADAFGELFPNFANNGADRATDDVEKVTGHPARSINDFAGDFAGIFGG